MFPLEVVLPILFTVMSTMTLYLGLLLPYNFESLNYENPSVMKAGRLLLIFSIISLILSLLSLPFSKTAKSKYGLIYLAIVSLCNMILGLLVLKKKPIANGGQTFIAFANFGVFVCVLFVIIGIGGVLQGGGVGLGNGVPEDDVVYRRQDN